MKAKTTKTTPIEITPSQFEEALARYSAAGLRGLEINKAIEAEVNEILEKYEDELQCASQTSTAAFETIRAYCAFNKKVLFNKRRSLGTPYGIVGFRLGTPRLKTEKGTSWKNIVEKLKETLPGYVRSVDEPAKDLLLADRNKENVAPLLMELGIQVLQDELFYIERKTAA